MKTVLIIIIGVIGYLVAKLIYRFARFFIKKIYFYFNPPQRDVSTLAGDEASHKSEVIKRSGPLKDNHRRVSYRDKRLLPKPKPDYNTWPLPPKKKVMSADEAGRLFSFTMRTQNREIRDLATDDAQLKRYGLPIWKNENDVAGALGLSVKKLRHMSIHRYRETCPHYYVFAIPKRRGGERLIYAPKKELKVILQTLNVLLINKLPVSDAAHGFVKKRSVATNAKEHIGKKLVVKFDLKDCFPTLHFGRVRGLFIALGYSYPVATTLAVLMTEAHRQPVKQDNKLYHIPVGDRYCVQGAPTSPGLCNAILLRMDNRLKGLSKKLGFTYTRYADDLSFSGDDENALKHLMHMVTKIVTEEGFEVNKDKTQIMRAGGRQSVTGVVVNDVVGLSKKDRRKLRAEIHQLKKNPEAITQDKLMRLQGKIAYISMLNPEQGRVLQTQLDGSVDSGG